MTNNDIFNFDHANDNDEFEIFIEFDDFEE